MLYKRPLQFHNCLSNISRNFTLSLNCLRFVIRNGKRFFARSGEVQLKPSSKLHFRKLVQFVRQLCDISAKSFHLFVDLIAPLAVLKADCTLYQLKCCPKWETLKFGQNTYCNRTSFVNNRLPYNSTCRRIVNSGGRTRLHIQVSSGDFHEDVSVVHYTRRESNNPVIDLNSEVWRTKAIVCYFTFVLSPIKYIQIIQSDEQFFFSR